MDNSPLRRLSPEIRNLIYEFIFASTTVTLDNFGDNATSLIRTCRAIRNESRLLLFSEAKLQLSKDFGTCDRVPPFPIGDTLADSFGQEVLEVLMDNEILIEGYVSRCVRLKCRGCKLSGRGNGFIWCTNSEVRLAERKGNRNWLIHFFSADWNGGDRGWRHAGFTCWKY